MYIFAKFRELEIHQNSNFYLSRNGLRLKFDNFEKDCLDLGNCILAYFTHFLNGTKSSN